jgi:hypothetical protein
MPNILVIRIPCAILAFFLAPCISTRVIAEEPDIAIFRQWVKSAGLAQDDLRPWPELWTTSGRAYRQSNAVLLSIDRLPANGTVSFPRLNNMCSLVYWLGDANRYSLRLTQTATDWTIHLPQAQPEGARPVVVLRTEGEPYLPAAPWVVAQAEDGSVTLPARHAAVHGEKLQYEPQPHKNTLGYWVNPEDWAEWHFETRKPGEFSVHILQGCGEGQGGSEVVFTAGEETLAFEVEDTGHFQDFRWRQVGKLLIEAGRQVLTVRVQRLARNAVMDLRQVRLVPE